MALQHMRQAGLLPGQSWGSADQKVLFLSVVPVQKWLIELYAGSQEVTMYAADQLNIPTANCLTVDHDPRESPMHDT